MTTLAMHALTLDEELQPRAAIDRTVLENYVQLLVDGVRFPPVVAFRDDNVLWLADGFHRWHSRQVLELADIEADIIDGSRRDALLYSLSANAAHGLQRSPSDYSRAYNTACRNGLVDSADIEAVAALLRCSGSWATKLTWKAREAAKVARDAEIIRLKGEGRTHREVAESVGVAPRTVTTVQRQHSAETAQERPHPDLAPFLSEAAKRNLRELASPPAENWAAALRALRLINEQASVDELFADRFARFDHVFGPALEAAHEWINELHGRFVNERQSQPRRA
jgi:hypothetical protein